METARVILRPFVIADTNAMFKNASEQKKEQKYHHWLELFDLKDTKTNQKHFLKFCEDNHINL